LVTPSVAVQVAPRLKPVTVKFAGSASDAVVSSLATEPLVQTRLTVTLAASFGTKFLLTVTVAERSVLVIVQCPRGRVAGRDR